MTPAEAALFLVALGAAAIDWIAVVQGGARVERIAKPTVVLALLLAVTAAGPVSGGGRWLLLVALVASLAGDVLLLPPGRFMPGLVAFLIAQVAYLGRFLLGPLDSTGLALGVAGAAVLLIVIGRAIVAGAGRARLQAPVIVYLVAICAMAIAASGSGSPLAAAGAWLFVASDAELGWDRFVAPSPGTARAASRRRLANIVLYHAGQILLVVALAG